MRKTEKLVAWLERRVGMRYTWGGKSDATGWDCSGLTWGAFKHIGIDLPQGSYNQAKVGREIPVEKAHGGCLLFKRRFRVGPIFHVAIVGRNKTVIEARGKKWGVVKRQFKPSEWHMAQKIDKLYTD